VSALAERLEDDSSGQNELILSFGDLTQPCATPHGARPHGSTVSVFRSLLDQLAQLSERRDGSEQLELQAVFTHASFCTEEVDTEAAVRQVLAEAHVNLVASWGALTMHHIEDLPWHPEAAAFPLYKGEFQKALKTSRVRPRAPLEPPRSRAPGPPESFLEALAHSAQHRSASFVRGKRTNAGPGDCAVARVFQGLLGLATSLPAAVAAFDPQVIFAKHPAPPASAAPASAPAFTGRILGRSPFLFPPPPPPAANEQGAVGPVAGGPGGRAAHPSAGTGGAAQTSLQAGTAGEKPAKQYGEGSWIGGERAALAYLDHLLFGTKP
jgi:hypothetical protein